MRTKKLTNKDKHGKTLVLSALEEDLLTLLNSNDRLYGLQIVDAINDAGQGQRILRSGTLYTTLRRMKTKKLVDAEWGDETDGGARRKYFKISLIGKEALQETQKYRARLCSWPKSSTDPNQKEKKISQILPSQKY
ncbi:MAG: helix-turn-helix transcriptional regulator [Cyanobacteria bacterium SBLK]|nr:helix-turn-helix transcriptional regulator [Cyanobacteria bacterium SBLK]